MTLGSAYEDKGTPTLLLGTPQGRHTLLLSVQPCVLECSGDSGPVRDCSRRGMLWGSPRRIPERTNIMLRLIQNPRRDGEGCVGQERKKAGL